MMELEMNESHTLIICFKEMVITTWIFLQAAGLTDIVKNV